jgi:hypothetical protein
MSNRSLGSDKLAAVWSLKHYELNPLKTKPARNHLGFVVQFKHYQSTCHFTHNPSDMSGSPVQYLTDQLDLATSDRRWSYFIGQHRGVVKVKIGSIRASAARFVGDFLKSGRLPRQ